MASGEAIDTDRTGKSGSTMPDEQNAPSTQSGPGAGYYHIPPIWVGSAIEHGKINDALTNPGAFPISGQLSKSKIRYRARQDGLILFDFSNWSEGSQVTIPAHRIVGGKLPSEIEAITEEARQHVFKRLLVLNVHIACLSAAMGNNSLPLMQVITAATYLSYGSDFNLWTLRGFAPAWQPIHVYITQAARPEITRLRRIVSLDEITQSFALLDRIISSPVPSILECAHLLFLAHFAYAQHDFANCVTMAWTVCEKLRSVLNKDRRTKLKSRGYTASDIAEGQKVSLNLNGELNKAKGELNKAKSARNAWLHEMKSVSIQQANTALTAARKMISLTSGITLQIFVGSSFTF